MIRIDIEDMHIRDERVLAWMKETAAGKPLQVSSEKIAKRFSCHPNTARAILKRLASAEYIEVIARPFNGGFVYRVKCGETRTCA